MLTRVALGSVSLLGNSNGYSPSQSWHRNLRPPAFTSVHRIGLLHLRQRGGGGFLTTMMLTLDLGGSTKLSVTDRSRRRAVMEAA